ncbi:MAG: hypothetical protein A2Z32_07410, partial [Chloroflexi bacterium RBG_16_69_14]
GPRPVIGLVTDGTLYDASYNQAAWEGVQAGAAAIGGRAVVLVPSDPSGYAKDIQRLSRRADVVVTVGFTMADATLAAALANPKVQFLGLDEWFGSTPDNLQGIVFDDAQQGFLAGIVAAGMTESVVGAVGGWDSIAEVLAYMNGYRNGAAWFDASVGYVHNYAGSFADPAAGYVAASELIDQDADVVMGVAGGSNPGIFAAVCEADGVWAIGVDVDQYLQLPEFQACLLTSAEKKLAHATSLAIQRWFAGRPGFESGLYVNGAWNDGIGLAPIRNVTVPASLQDALDTAYAGLANGSISACLPTDCLTK